MTADEVRIRLQVGRRFEMLDAALEFGLLPNAEIVMSR
jgi:hypothetical protein